MAFQQLILQRLAQLTELYNSVVNNSKKIDELPSQSVLDLTSLIGVSRGGNSEKLSLQLLANALSNNTYNRVISIDGDITVSGNNVTIPATIVEFNNVIYTEANQTVLNVPFTNSAGLEREDWLIFDVINSDIVVVNGNETNGIIVPPNLPANSVFITKYKVTDSLIHQPENVIIGTSFIKKSDAQGVAMPLSGNDVIVQLPVNGESSISFTNNSLNTVAGFSIDNVNELYQNKPFSLYNTTANPITIVNNSGSLTGSQLPFLSRTNNDLIVPAGEFVYLLYSNSGFIDNLKSWSTPPASTDTNFQTVSALPTTNIDQTKLYKLPDGSFNWYDGADWNVVSGGSSKKTQSLMFQVPANATTLTADQKIYTQARFNGQSVFGTLGLVFGNGVSETAGVINLQDFSDRATPQITSDYVSKVKKVVFSYSRNTNESSSNTNVMIRLLGEDRYNNGMQLICEHNLVSNNKIASEENKVEIPILTHANLIAYSNLKWCIRVNNATAQTFIFMRLNVIIEEV